MPKFSLHYIDPAGARVKLIDGLETLERAREEAALIFNEYFGGEMIASPTGFIEICDQHGASVSKVHFPARYQ